MKDLLGLSFPFCKELRVLASVVFQCRNASKDQGCSRNKYHFFVQPFPELPHGNIAADYHVLR